MHHVHVYNTLIHIHIENSYTLCTEASLIHDAHVHNIRKERLQLLRGIFDSKYSYHNKIVTRQRRGDVRDGLILTDVIIYIVNTCNNLIHITDL